MRFQEILNEKKLRKHKHAIKQKRDLDDVEDKPEDADQDAIPHIMMQLMKAIDVEGNYPITFRDGSKAKLGMEQIANFVKKYMAARPDEKEMMQSMASNSLEGFMSALNKPEKPKFSQKIKGTRYMSHFAGDHDEK